MSHFLSQWRAEINAELHTNAHKLPRCTYPSLSIPEDFPDMDVLRNYINPICSASVGHQGGGALRDNGDLSIPRLAAFCEDYFDEWGHRSGILKRFRNVIWEASVMRVLRRAALEADEKEQTKRIRAGRTDTAIRGVLQLPTTEGVGTPASLAKKYLSPAEVDHRAAIFVRRNNPAPPVGSEPDLYPIIRKILSARHHVSTDNLLEYRVEVDPRQLVALAESGIKGTHREPLGLGNMSNGESNEDDDDDATSSQGTKKRKRKSKAPVDPRSMMRLWIPACIMRQVHPGLVEDYEEAERAKLAKKDGVQRRRRKASDEGEEAASSDVDANVASFPSRSAARPTGRLAAREIHSPLPRIHTQSRASVPGSSRQTAQASSGHPWPAGGVGFFFTFTDPIDPDVLAADDSDVPLTVCGGSEQPLHDILESSSRATHSISRNTVGNEASRRPRVRKSAAAPSATAPADRSLAEDDEMEYGLPGRHDELIDRLLGVRPGPSKGKKAQMKSKRPGAPGSAAGRPSVKRRKIVQLAAEPTDNPAPPPAVGTSSASWMASSLSDRASTPRRDDPPAPFPSLSPPRDPAPTRRRRAASIPKAEIESDSDNVAPARKAALRAPHSRYSHLAEPSSSQDSALSSTDFLRDASVVIDLTSR